MLIFIILITYLPNRGNSVKHPGSMSSNPADIKRQDIVVLPGTILKISVSSHFLC